MATTTDAGMGAMTTLEPSMTLGPSMASEMSIASCLTGSYVLSPDLVTGAVLTSAQCLHELSEQAKRQWHRKCMHSTRCKGR